MWKEKTYPLEDEGRARKKRFLDLDERDIIKGTRIGLILLDQDDVTPFGEHGKERMSARIKGLFRESRVCITQNHVFCLDDDLDILFRRPFIKLHRLGCLTSTIQSFNHSIIPSFHHSNVSIV